jgi:hypothetical protein
MAALVGAHRSAENISFHPTEGSLASATPATDGNRVVVYFGSCGLLTYDLGQRDLRLSLPLPGKSVTGSGVACPGRNLVLLNRDQTEVPNCCC